MTKPVFTIKLFQSRLYVYSFSGKCLEFGKDVKKSIRIHSLSEAATLSAKITDYLQPTGIIAVAKKISIIQLSK